MEIDHDWQTRYADFIATPRNALSHVRPGHRVFIGTGCGEPVSLVKALVAKAGELSNVEIIHLLTKGEAPYANKKYADCFTINSFYIGENVRDMIQQGVGSYTPVLMSDIPKLFDSGQIPIDVVLIQVSPPNILGKVSLGISVDIVKSAAENGSFVIAQVNPQMVWTCGDSCIDVHDIDLLVAVDEPLLERPSKPLSTVTKQIAKHVVSLVEDGSTLQFGMGRIPGVGRIPPAVMHYLTEKKHLGIHTEMITDSILKLLESGAVDGSRKNVDRGKVVASFCMGTKKLYDTVAGNPLFSFRPTEYVNDPFIIAKQDKMVAINMALEVDLTGQICSDSQGDKFYSGIGGQMDFTRGASMSEGGKAIIALSALDTKSGLSRIVSRLTPGSGVVTTRGAVQYVVSEYGVAFLFGKNVQERALALISIAHPDFRESLLKEAVEAKFISPDFADIEGRFVVANESMKTSKLLRSGILLNFRAIHPTDESRVRELMYNLSQETIYYRFMSHQQKFSSEQIQDFVYVDHRKDVAIVGVVPEAHGEDIVAVGRYYLDEKTNRAEVAFVLRDEWQRQGIGTFLFRHLVTIAKNNGIAGFTAEVLRENKGMQAIFHKSGYKVETTLEEGVYSIRLDF